MGEIASGRKAADGGRYDARFRLDNQGQADRGLGRCHDRSGLAGADALATLGVALRLGVGRSVLAVGVSKLGFGRTRV